MVRLSLRRRTGRDPGSMPGHSASRGASGTLARLGMVLVLLVVGGCARSNEAPCPDGTDHFVRYELFMGRSGPGGEVVDDAAWETFLAETVTPRFPDGLTAIDAQGQWRDAEGTVQRERSKLLVILAAPDDGATSRIDEMIGEYKRRFSQESVLLVVEDTCVAFE